MLSSIRVARECDRERFFALSGPTPVSAESVARTAADAQWLVVDGDAVVARCSLWWRATPTYQDHHVGLIGHYYAAGAAPAAHLLKTACEQLAASGCTLAVGPMDGSTRERYRLLTERGSEPLFFLEPDNPDDWPAHFTENGFAPLAEYYSALQRGLDHDDPRLPGIATRLESDGICIRTLDMARFEDELRGIYTVAAPSFQQNVLAGPLSETEFLEQYRPVAPFLRPELVLIAECAGQPVGFLFTVPDWLQAQRGEPVNTVVVKTLAVLPEYAGRGLGTLLSARCERAARALGFTRAIHALMHERNTSRRISGRYDGGIIRRYTLFARTLP